MKAQIGTKHYNTETAEFIDTLPDGIQVYKKKGRSSEFFLFNPEGQTMKQRFFDLPYEEAKKYIPETDSNQKVYRSGATIQLSPYDRDRIKHLAMKNGMSMAQFLLMLVDEYERTH